MTYYEKIISGGPDALAEVLADVCCDVATKATRKWLGDANDIPESLHEDVVESYRKILMSEYKEN